MKVIDKVMNYEDTLLAYICVCGNRTWVIHGHVIECTRCGKNIAMGELVSPVKFNSMIEKYKKGENMFEHTKTIKLLKEHQEELKKHIERNNGELRRLYKNIVAFKQDSEETQKVIDELDKSIIDLKGLDNLMEKK